MRNAKHRSAPLVAVLVLLGGVFASARSQDVKLTAWTDSTAYQIGRWITLRVDGEMPATVDTLVPVVFDTLGPFEVLARAVSEPAIDGTRKKQTWKFRLTTFDAGDVVIPPVPFAYRTAGDTVWHIARSAMLPLSITTVIVDTSADIRDIKPPVDAPWKLEDLLPYLIFLWALAVIAAVAFLIVHYRKKRALAPAPVVPQPAVAAHEAAIAALRDVEDRHLWQKGKVKQYYSEVTDIIRLYFERRFGLRALEMTTDEVLQGLRKFRAADAVAGQVSGLLLTADLVKFAKHMPTPDENAEELARAYRIVRETAPTVAVEHPASQEASRVR